MASPRTGVITFSRLHLPASSLPSWSSSDQNLACLHLSTEGKIETEGAGFLQADFANEYIGGGVLRSGLVQEEIRFTICPELIATMLFSERLSASESIGVYGAEAPQANFFLRISAKILSIFKNFCQNFCQNSTPKSA